MANYRLVFLIAAFLSFASVAVEPPATAQPPSQAKLTKMLGGNTLDGEWAGRPFRQYFSTSRSTRYREGDGPESMGTWRVDGSGRYCSVWPPSARESCYEVLVEGDKIYWKSGSDYYPSVVIEGDVF
jgi:hypothetical protein